MSTDRNRGAVEGPQGRVVGRVGVRGPLGLIGVGIAAGFRPRALGLLAQGGSLVDGPGRRGLMSRRRCSRRRDGDRRAVSRGRSSIGGLRLGRTGSARLLRGRLAVAAGPPRRRSSRRGRGRHGLVGVISLAVGRRVRRHEAATRWRRKGRRRQGWRLVSSCLQGSRHDDRRTLSGDERAKRRWLRASVCSGRLERSARWRDWNCKGGDRRAEAEGKEERKNSTSKGRGWNREQKEKKKKQAAIRGPREPNYQRRIVGEDCFDEPPRELQGRAPKAKGRKKTGVQRWRDAGQRRRTAAKDSGEARKRRGMLKRAGGDDVTFSGG